MLLASVRYLTVQHRSAMPQGSYVKVTGLNNIAYMLVESEALVERYSETFKIHGVGNL